MDFHNIIVFGIIVAVCIWSTEEVQYANIRFPVVSGIQYVVCIPVSHGYMNPKLRQEQELRCPGKWSDKWYYFNGSCYFYSFYRYPETWDYAQASCFLEDAQLVEIESAAELAFLVDLKQIWSKNSLPAWIGLHDRDIEGTHTLVSTGKVANYTNWDKGEPNDNDWGACVQMTNTGLWNDISCRSERHYFCERQVNAIKCPKGWTLFRGSCYKYEHTKHTWEDAAKACSNNESHLVEITSAAETSFVDNLMKSWRILSLYKEKLYEYEAWIGLGNRRGLDNYIWYSSGMVANYTNWGNLEPIEVAGPDCVNIGLSGFWYNIPCLFTREYICERPANEACEDGWSFFNRRCYKYSENKASWMSAQIDCNAGWAALVDITSAAENAFLFNLRNVSTAGIPSAAWIGLYVDDDTYTWYTSGNTTSYTNWAVGQPDNDHNSKNCVEMNEGGKWNDNSCTTQITYFCEKSSIGSA